MLDAAKQKTLCTRFAFSVCSLIASLCVALPAPSAHANVFKKAYKCLEANGEAIVQGAEIGVKVLEFIATKPQCVGQLVTPAPFIPQVTMGITVTYANIQGFKTYSQCSGNIYGFVAKPALDGVKSALDAFGSVPPPLDSLKSGLANLAAENAVELLMSVPGAEIVTGGIDCGCGLVEAGLKVETVKKIYNSLKKVANTCGEFIKELGPLGQGIVAVTGAISDGWNDTINDPQHMPVNQYYDMHWKPYTESLAQQYALPQPPQTDIWTAVVKPVWDRCVHYFDSHNQYRSVAILTCNGMRDGTRDFQGNGGFIYAVYKRTWDLATPGAVEYYSRYLVNQQRDLAKAAGLNEFLRAAMAARVYRDFGLDARGNANRNNLGDVAWREGSFGARTLLNKQPLAGFNSLQHRATRDTVLDALIEKGYKISPTVEVIKSWKDAYPAIAAAKCVSTPPLQIRIPSSGEKPTIRTTIMTCAEKGVTDAQQQSGLTACDIISRSIKEDINLVCQKPTGEQVSDAQVEMLKWHKEKRFAAANLNCAYDIFWNSKAIGCSDPLYTTQCNALVAKELGAKFGIPTAGVMDCQVKRSPNEKKWEEVMPQVAKVMAIGFSFNANTKAPAGSECKRDDLDPLMLYCKGMPANSTSDGYQSTEQMLGKGMVRECSKAERDDKHWVASPCIVWDHVVFAGDNGTNAGSIAKAGAGVTAGALVKIPHPANSSAATPIPQSLTSGGKPGGTLSPPLPTGASQLGGSLAKAPMGSSGLGTSSGVSLAPPMPTKSIQLLQPIKPTQETTAADAAAFKKCRPYHRQKEEMLCTGEPAFEACVKLVDAEEMKTCRLGGTQTIYPKPKLR